MKKLLALMLTAALALSLVACGGGSGAGDNNSTNTPTTGEDGTTTNELTADQCVGTWKLDVEESEHGFAGMLTMELSKGGVGKGTDSRTTENSYIPLVWEISDGILKVSLQVDSLTAAFEVTDDTMVATDGSCSYNKES